MKQESPGKSIQHAARDVRYCFFDEIADTLRFDKIAIAHNLDDQIETFLLRIVKGTGICWPLFNSYKTWANHQAFSYYLSLQYRRIRESKSYIICKMILQT